MFRFPVVECLASRPKVFHIPVVFLQKYERPKAVLIDLFSNHRGIAPTITEDANSRKRIVVFRLAYRPASRQADRSA